MSRESKNFSDELEIFLISFAIPYKSRVPKGLLSIVDLGEVSGKGKKVVAESVEILNAAHLDFVVCGQSDNGAFCAPTHTSRNMAL